MTGWAMSEGKRLVPNLRFPEFQDADEWDLFPLSSFVESLDAGVSVNSGDRPAKKGEASVLKTSAVTCGTFDHQENKVVLDEVEIQRLKESVCKNTVIISRMNTPDLVGANAYVEESMEDIFLPDRLWAARSKPGTSMRFISYILGSDKGRAALSKMASGSSGSMKNITKPDVLSLQVTAPAFVEQQKIADCLSSLDELIAAQARKVDALKTHKKGLMLQIFPREDETEPRLRFSEFRGTEEWQKRKISTLLIKSVNPVDVDLATTYREIGIRSHGKGIFHKEPVFGKALGGKRVFWVVEDALVLNIVFAWEQALSVTSSAEAGMIASHRFPMFKARLGKADVNFIKYFFLTKKGKELLGIASPGGAGRNKTLGKRDFDNLEFLFPSNAEEQNGIANLLSSIDALIVSRIQQLDTLKIHKKGLMQQLFPSAEALDA